MSEEQDQKNIELIKSHIGEFPDFPRPGIIFRDIFTAMCFGEVCSAIKDLFMSHIRKSCPDIDAVVGLDARGFLFSFMIAAELKIACIPVRKKGKLPGECFSFEYVKEYGTDVFEIQKNSLKPGQKVLIVDDLLATGGSLLGATKLVEKTGAIIQECLILLELVALKGRDEIPNCKVHSLIRYD